MSNDATRDLRVLCAGDAFIGASTLGEAARRHLGNIEVVPLESAWPDTPFGDVDGVREAAGDPAEVAAAVVGCDLVLTHLAPLTAAVLEAAAPSVRLVGSVRGGPVNIDLAAASRRRLPVAFLPGRNLEAVAEFTVGATIALTRNIGSAGQLMAAGEWDASSFRFERCGPELSACTVGIVGLGAVGQRVATLFAAFGATVLAHDPFADAARARALGVELVDLETLLAGSDVVTVHARVSEQTRGMFGVEQFARMRAGSYFVNTARGELVDHDALRDSLASGHLAGAALDVFNPEPPALDDPLRQAPSLATPHLAGASRQVALASADRIARAAAGFLRTGTLQHCANPDALEGR